MENFISNSESLLRKFLSDSDKIIKSRNGGSLLASFALPFDSFKSVDFINHLAKDYERSLYFEIPAENLSIAGLDEALIISENGEGRFAVTDKKIKEWKNSFISNWESLPDKKIPLFLGGMKFSSEHNEDDWQDYNDSTWFVPELMIFHKQSLNYLFFNFLIQNSSKELAAKKFRIKLEKLFKLNGSQVKTPSPVILKSYGDSPKDKKKWKQLVSESLGKISENQFEKVVLSRKVELQLSNEPDMKLVIENLRKDNPNCYIFLYHHGKSSFFGATPEMLAKFSNGCIEVDALAGSAHRGKTEDEDTQIEKALLRDDKNLTEHNYVIEHIRNTVSSLTEDFKIESRYSIKKLANIQHIWSRITARLSNKSSMMSILKELYPTPAICGFPKEASFHLIKKVEGYKRGLYSGIIGWFNFDDEGEFAVALRSALLTSNKLVAFAGGGIVQNSDPEAEYKETELKLKTIMSLFKNENKN